MLGRCWKTRFFLKKGPISWWWSQKLQYQLRFEWVQWYETLAIIYCMLVTQASWWKSWLYYSWCFYMFLMAFGHVREIPYGNLGVWMCLGQYETAACFTMAVVSGELFGLTCPHLEPNLRKWKGFRAHENNFCWSFAHGISEYCITPKRNPGLVLDLFL